MALTLNNLKRVDMPLNQKTKPNQTTTTLFWTCPYHLFPVIPHSLSFSGFLLHLLDLEHHFVTQWVAFISVCVGAGQRISLSVLARNPHKESEIFRETGSEGGKEGHREDREKN